MSMTKGQEALYALAVETPKRGLTVEVCQSEYSAGATWVLNQVRQKRVLGPGQTRIVTTLAVSAWNVVIKLGLLSKTRGRSYDDSLTKALHVLTDNGTRPLCIIMDKCEFLNKPNALTKLLKALEAVILEENLSVRLIYIFGEVSCWDSMSRCYRERFMDLSPIFTSACKNSGGVKVCLTRKGLEEVRSQDGAVPEFGKPVAMLA